MDQVVPGDVCELYMYMCTCMCKIQRDKNIHALIYTLLSGYIYIDTDVCEAQNDFTQLETLLNTLTCASELTYKESVNQLFFLSL